MILIFHFSADGIVLWCSTGSTEFVCFGQIEGLIWVEQVIKRLFIWHTSSNWMPWAYYCKNALGVAIFIGSSLLIWWEHLRIIPQQLHELHRKVPHLLSCDDKDAMTVKTQKKIEKIQTAKIITTLYISEKLVKKQSFLKQKWTKLDDKQVSYNKKELWLTQN